MRSNTNNIQLTSPSDAPLLGTLLSVDELFRIAVTTEWPRAPSMREIERTAELVTVAGYHSLGDFLDTSAAERSHLYN